MQTVELMLSDINGFFDNYEHPCLVHPLPIQDRDKHLRANKYPELQRRFGPREHAGIAPAAIRDAQNTRIVVSLG